MAASVIIVENSEIIRKGMVDILQGSGLFDRIRELSCAANMMEMVSRYQPDVLFINPSMIDGQYRTQLVNGTGHTPKLAAIIYSFHDEALMDAFDEVFPINDSRPRIIKKLNALVKKETRGKTNPDNRLTPREIAVLKLLVKGHSNKEVSGKLFISTHTVISHRKNIIRKLNIKSIAGLTVYAILNGILGIDELE